MAATRSLRSRVGLARPRRRREIVTPEGVALPVDLADRGERAAAVLIDLIIIVAALLVFWLVLWLALGGEDTAPSGWGLAFALVVSFALRSFYFTFFELRWHGRTPGKRLLRLRVIDRRGGRLRSDAVFARNLMREVELFLPISLLIAGESLGGGGWVALLTLVWVFIFVLMPLDAFLQRRTHARGRRRRRHLGDRRTQERAAARRRRGPGRRAVGAR